MSGNVVSFPRPTAESVTRLKTKQLEALRYIEGFIQTHGEWPTFEQIGDAADIRSKVGVSRVVNHLFQANAISKPPS